MYWAMSLLKTELGSTLRLAIPIVMGLLGQVSLQLVDTAMVGQVGVVPLAAVSFASSILSIFLVIGFGLAVAVHVLVATAWGAEDQPEAVSMLGHGLLVALLYSALCVCLLLAGERMLYCLGQPEEVVDACLGYYRWVVVSIIPALLFHNVKSYAESCGRPWLPVMALAIGLLLNVFLNWILIFGRLGVPAYGAAGAGAATFIARMIMLGLIWLSVSRGISGHRQLFSRIRYSGAKIRRLLGLGGPSAIQILFEVGMFSVITLMMGWISARTLAAHQIALNIASFAFMVPLGLSFATSIRVGEARGRGHYQQVRSIALGSILFSALFMTGYAVVVICLRNQLPVLFVADDATQAIAASLLLAAGLFAICDGIQITTMGVLRGLYDVRLPTLFVFVSYWLISLPAGAALAFGVGLQGFGLWMGLVVGLSIASILLGGRLYWILSHTLQRNQPR